MKKRVALVAFNGDPMCFVHVLLNAIDFSKKGYDTRVVIEGNATKLVRELAAESNPFASLFKKVKELGLIDCVCKAGAAKMSASGAVVEQNLKQCDELSGHPSLEKYVEQGYQVITF